MSTSNTEKLPLSPDSSGRSSRLRLRCSRVRPRKREWYRVSREPRKDVARSSSEGQRDRQMASRTWKPWWHSAASSTEPPTWPCTWAPVTATGSGAARTEPRHSACPRLLNLSCMQHGANWGSSPPPRLPSPKLRMHCPRAGNKTKKKNSHLCSWSSERNPTN